MNSRVGTVLIISLSAVLCVLAYQARTMRIEIETLQTRAATPQIGTFGPRSLWTDAQGGTVEFPSRKGSLSKVAFFFTTQCPYCVQTLPAVAAMARSLNAKRPGSFVGVSLSATADTRAYIDTHGIDYPVLMDDGTKFADAIRMSTVPSVVLFDGDGRITKTFTGILSSRDVEEFSSLILAQDAEAGSSSEMGRP